MRFVEALHHWTLDGQPGLTVVQIRRWAAGVAAQLAQDGYPASLRPLRGLRDLARRLGDQPLAAAVTGLMSTLRMGGSGIADQARVDANLRQLKQWAAAEVPDVAMMAGWSAIP